MAGKAWSPERRAAHADVMRLRWRDPVYRAAQSDKYRRAMTQDRRAEKSRYMIELNRRMKCDSNLKAANLAGIHRSYLDGTRSKLLARTMRETMARPEMRVLAADHCKRLKGSGHTSRAWKTRRIRIARRRAEAAMQKGYSCGAG